MTSMIPFYMDHIVACIVTRLIVHYNVHTVVLGYL
jgi:hypothetical protein